MSTTTKIDKKSKTEYAVRDALIDTLKVTGYKGKHKYGRGKKKVDIDVLKFLEEMFDASGAGPFGESTLPASVWGLVSGQKNTNWNDAFEAPNTAGMIKPKNNATWEAAWKLDAINKATSTSAVDTALVAWVKLQIKDLLVPIRSGRGTKADSKGTTRSEKGKTDAYTRDGWKCVITGVFSNKTEADAAANAVAGSCRVQLEIAHILPHHLANKSAALKMIEAFTGNKITAAMLKGDKVDDVANLIPLSIDCHRAFDRLEWSIEHKPVQGQQSPYTLRWTRNAGGGAHKAPDAGMSVKEMGNGKVITTFGDGDPSLDRPNPLFCNLHYAICKVVNAVGLADVFNEQFDDDEPQQPDPVQSQEVIKRLESYSDDVQNVVKKLKTDSSPELAEHVGTAVYGLEEGLWIIQQESY